MNIQSHALALRADTVKPMWTLADVQAVAIRATLRSTWSAL